MPKPDFDNAIEICESQIDGENDETAKLWKEVKTQLELAKQLKIVGGAMSNICFNLAQDGFKLDEHTRARMKKMQQQWDSVGKTANV